MNGLVNPLVTHWSCRLRLMCQVVVVGGHTVVIHAFLIGGTGPGDRLKLWATEAGGWC